ncbi:hypothetical protein [Sphingomonas sp. ID0503]|uniref:hypothetical protein n=1 Tax=Sphingomonas sp. ID0503 TaxID=3399691 RepID=UPI003AFA912E
MIDRALKAALAAALAQTMFEIAVAAGALIVSKIKGREANPRRKSMGYRNRRAQSRAAWAASGGGVALPFTPLIPIISDSNGLGVMSDPSFPVYASDAAAFTSAYQSDSKAKVMDAANAVQVYAPGTVTGVAAHANTTVGNVSYEAGIFQRFRELYPSNDIIVAKRATAGAFAGRAEANPQLGDLVGSVSGRVLTLTSGSPQTNRLLVADGMPDRIHISSGTGPYNLSYFGGGSLPSFTLPAGTTIKQFSGYSWSPTTGFLYIGTGAVPTGFAKSKFRQQMDALTAANIVWQVPFFVIALGGNDADFAFSANAYQARVQEIITAFRTDFPETANAKVVIVMTPAAGSTYSSTVRAACAALRDADPLVRLVEAGKAGYVRPDGTHHDIATRIAIGRDIAGVGIGGMASA